MKLRNKKTGEIGYLTTDTVDRRLRVLNDNNDTVDEYNSLAELNEEWEDYEEPKEYYWYIDADGNALRCRCDDRYDNEAKEIGNYFKTEEDAEKAVEKLKAWKRLKDRGFEFIELRAPNYGSSEIITIKARCPWTSKNIDDLGICFGGGE